MKNSQQHLGNEANLATFSLSHDVIFLMVSPLLGRFLVSFNLQSEICGLQSVVCSLQSAVCGLQSANVIHRIPTTLSFRCCKVFFFQRFQQDFSFENSFLTMNNTVTKRH